MINQYKSHGKLGVIVSGEPNIVKTTTVSHIARRFERRRRDIGRARGGNSIPVIYVLVPPPYTPKLMLGEFAHFLGLPVRAHYKIGDLMNTVASVIAACGTELIIVDEIHNINRKYKQMGEAPTPSSSWRRSAPARSSTPEWTSKPVGCSTEPGDGRSAADSTS